VSIQLPRGVIIIRAARAVAAQIEENTPGKTLTSCDRREIRLSVASIEATLRRANRRGGSF